MPELIQGTQPQPNQTGLLQILSEESIFGLGIKPCWARNGMWKWEGRKCKSVAHCISSHSVSGVPGQVLDLETAKSGAGERLGWLASISHLILPGDILHGHNTVVLMLRRLAAGLTQDQTILFAEHL